MRSTMRPPRLLALSHASRLQARLPRCSRPLGLGAKRPVGGIISDLSQCAWFCIGGSFQPLDDLKLPTRSLWQYQRKYYFIYSRLSRSAEHSKRMTVLPLESPTGAFIAAQPRSFRSYFFTGRGRNGKRHMLTLAPCGSIRVSMKTCCCPYVSSRSDYKSAQHKKSFRSAQEAALSLL